ncbi:MAG TPA: hypothetical protein EYP74_04180, partial [Anaerolineales bacterium]|nr:hypothetical protein [Anaerolineales bacterium]
MTEKKQIGELTKEYITTLKENNNGGLEAFVNARSDDKSVLFVLRNIGRLPNDFEGEWVSKFLSSKNQKIR